MFSHLFLLFSSSVCTLKGQTLNIEERNILMCLRDNQILEKVNYYRTVNALLSSLFLSLVCKSEKQKQKTKKYELKLGKTTWKLIHCMNPKGQKTCCNVEMVT